MPPFDAALKLADPQPDINYVADNDDRAGATRDISNKFVYAAADMLIGRRREGAIIKVEAFAPPHDALVEIAEKLETLGIAQSMADHLINALKDYVVSKGGSFARAANAKPILIALEVAEAKPDFRFEEGVTELAAIDGVSARVEGIGNVEIQYTASGTSMTSNRASVDKIFSAVKGWKLWVRFEAPTQSEMDGVLNDMQGMMAMMGEAVGGAMSAADLKEVLVKMEQDGSVTPETIALIVNLIELRSLVEAGVTPQSESKIQGLAETISLQLSTLAESGIPVVVAQGAVQSIARLVDTHDIAHVIPPQTIKAMDTHIAVQTVVLQLAVVAQTLDDAPRAELETLIETLQTTALDDIAPVLESVTAHIEKADLSEVVAQHAPALPALEKAVQVITVAQAEPALLAHETRQSVQTLVADLQQVKETLSAKPDAAPVIAALEQAVDALRANPADMNAVQQIAALENFVKDGALPPALAAPLAKVIEQQVSVIAAKQELPVAAVRDAMQAVATLETLKAADPKALSAVRIEPADIIKVLEGRATPDTITATVAALQIAAEKADASPAVKKAAEAIIAVQTAALVRDTGLPPVVAENAVRVAAQAERLTPEIKTALAKNGIDVKTLSDIKSSPVKTMAALAAVQDIAAANPRLIKNDPVFKQIVERLNVAPRTLPVALASIIKTAALADAVASLPRREIKELIRAGVDVTLMKKITSPAATPADLKAAERMMARITPANRAIIQRITQVDVSPPPKPVYPNIRQAFKQDNQSPHAVVARRAEMILATVGSALNSTQRDTLKTIADTIRTTGKLPQTLKTQLATLTKQLPPSPELTQLKKMDILASERTPPNRTSSPDLPRPITGPQREMLEKIIDKVAIIPPTERAFLKESIARGDVTQRQIDSVIERAAADPDISAVDMREIVHAERAVNWPEAAVEAGASFEKPCAATCTKGKNCSECFKEATAEQLVEMDEDMQRILAQSAVPAKPKHAMK